MHGGGIGKYIADWIQNGEPPFELNDCDPLRFGSWATDDYTLKKAREGYGMNNAIAFPHEERFAGMCVCVCVCVREREREHSLTYPLFRLHKDEGRIYFSK